MIFTDQIEHDSTRGWISLIQYGYFGIFEHGIIVSMLVGIWYNFSVF